ncbi:MAG: hypothetical protein WCY05_07440 [Candidatus Omnitrophota bacterium]
MKITIDIKTDNAAFEDSEEMGRILRIVVTKITTNGDTEGLLRDSNGNTVGKFKVTGK